MYEKKAKIHPAKLQGLVKSLLLKQNVALLNIDNADAYFCLTSIRTHKKDFTTEMFLFLYKI